jgi:putative ABC transport system permease protein
MTGLIQLDFIDLGWALGMIGLAIGLSAWQRLGLEWQLGQAGGRTLIQMTLVGYLLAAVFDPRAKNPWLVMGVLIIMLAIASVVAKNRISKKIKGLFLLVSSSILVSAAFTLIYVNLLIIKPPTWYEPQYIIPLAGILIGNAMNAATISGERLVSILNSSQIEIETHLSLGATPLEAVSEYRKDAVKAGLIPTINTMMIVGVVTLPGTITGQLLSGVSPLDAASYQILIMFMLALTTVMSTSLLTAALCRKFFNKSAQLMKF